MTRILVFGKNGQLATALAKAEFGSEIELIFIGSTEFNLIQNVLGIHQYIINSNSFDAVINASAYTDVDKAEMQNAQDAWVLNALVPRQMAQACKLLQIPFIHVSTESVFSGLETTPYTPTSKTNPANFYGLTKLKGEYWVNAVNGMGAVFRTSWVFSNTGNNFVKTILRVAKKNDVIQVVDDQIGLPIYAPDLAAALLAVIRFTVSRPTEKLYPTYHIAGGGRPINRYDYAKLIVQLSGLKTNIVPISSNQFAAIAPRPKNAVLDTGSFTSKFNIDLPDWQIGLKHMFSKVG